jgi:hypothetical protein
VQTGYFRQTVHEQLPLTDGDEVQKFKGGGHSWERHVGAVIFSGSDAVEFIVINLLQRCAPVWVSKNSIRKAFLQGVLFGTGGGSQFFVDHGNYSITIMKRVLQCDLF